MHLKPPGPLRHQDSSCVPLSLRSNTDKVKGVNFCIDSEVKVKFVGML